MPQKKFIYIDISSKKPFSFHMHMYLLRLQIRRIHQRADAQAGGGEVASRVMTLEGDILTMEQKLAQALEEKRALQAKATDLNIK